MNAQAINNLEVRGRDPEEGYDIYRDVIYLLVALADGSRLIGPEIGFLGVTVTPEEVDRKVAILEHALACGLDVSDWEPWFPVYGSTAYETSNQEALDCWVEKRNDKYGEERAYIPAERS
ncbi:MAG: hypothetical protein ACYS7Y_04075 [Planctomycetota bacterium]|jgi:hypothetical protein